MPYKIVRPPTITDVELSEKPDITSEFLPNIDINNPSGPVITSNNSAIVSPIITLTGTTPTINCANGVNRIFEITLTGNTTYSVINVAIGQVFIVRVKQGSGTTYVNTWFSTVTWITSGSTAPVQTTTSNGVTTYGFLCRAANVYDGYLLGNQ